MISQYKPTILGAAIGAAIVTIAILALSARAEDAGPPIDAPIVLADGPAVGTPAAAVATQDAVADPVQAGPVVEPTTVSEAGGLASWIWARFKGGQASAALTVLLHAGALSLIKRKDWVAIRLPWLVKRRTLAALTSFTGATATIVPLAVEGAPVGVALLGAALAAIGVYMFPGPVEVAGQTVPSGTGTEAA